MFKNLLKNEYGLHLIDLRKSPIGAGSDTYFLTCDEGNYVLKYSSDSFINHHETEPGLCEFLRKNGIPACDFLKNKQGVFLRWTRNVVLLRSSVGF